LTEVPGKLGLFRVGSSRIYLAPVLHDRLSGKFSGESAAAAILNLKPRQVMLEIDNDRFKSTLEALKQNRSIPQPSRVDIVATVHGGLMTRELKEAVNAAKSVDASIYLVDRPYGITQNRVAAKVLNPVVFSNFLKYAAKCVEAKHPVESSGDQLASGCSGLPLAVRELNGALQTSCPSIHRVLIDERNEFMANQISAQAVKSEDVIVVCGAAQAEGLARLLCDQKALDQIDLSEISRQGMSMWPLVLSLYFVLPVFLVLQVWLGAVAWVNHKFCSLFGIQTSSSVASIKPSISSG
jgi:pheromone shutdown protein TraB